MRRPKIHRLNANEKERRWQQHQASKNGSGRSTVKGQGMFSTKNPLKYLRGKAHEFDNRVLKSLPKGSFADYGAKIGAYLGNTELGRAGGNLLSHITGRGNYNITSNSIISGDDLKPAQLSFSPTGSASVRIKKREFIDSMVVPAEPGAFDTRSFRLQCTDTSTFPWLCDIANHFTEWQLMGCVFSFETSSSNYAADMALGTIAIGTQYNANERKFRTMDEILQSPYHTRGNPSESLMHGIECDPTLQVSEGLFTRRVGCEGPPNLYDHGVVTVATEGLPAQAGQIIGRLYVTYDIELSLPVLPAPVTHAGYQCVFQQLDTYATTGPITGATADLSYVMGNLSMGSGISSQIMTLPGSYGPHPKPDVDPDVDLVAWVSDSLSVAGGQYITFAEPGTYQFQANFFATAVRGVLASDFSVDCLGDNIECTQILSPVVSLGTNNNNMLIVSVTTKAAHQTLLITRLTAVAVSAVNCITVCDI